MAKNYYFIEESSSTSPYGTMPVMHAHAVYELYFLIDGEKTYITTSTVRNIQKNSLIITAPKISHKFERGPFHRILIQVMPNLLSPSQCVFLNRLAEKDVILFDDKQMRVIHAILKKMLKVFNTPTKDSETIIFLLLGKLFAFIYQYGKQEKGSFRLETPSEAISATPVIMKVMDYLNDHYTEKITLDFLANKFFISKTWLIKCFTHTTNMTVIEYKLHLQINKAKNLLFSEDKTLDQVAKECGFSSTNYFGMMFKKYVGVAPTKFCKCRKKSSKT